MFLVSLLPLAALGFFSYTNAEGVIRSQAEDHVDSLASVQEDRIQNHLMAREQIFRLVADRGPLLSNLQNYSSTFDPGYRSNVARELDDVERPVPTVLRVEVADMDGRVIASTQGNRTDLDVSSEEPFRVGRLDLRVDLLTRENGSVVIYMTGPLVWWGDHVGVLMIKEEPMDLFAVVQDYAGLGKTGETAIVRRDGQGNAVYLTPLRFDPDAALVQREPLSSDSAAADALAGREGVRADVSDYRGEQVVASTRYIEEADWGLVVKIDRDEVFLPLARLAGVLAAITVVALTVSGVGAMWLASRISIPIRELRRTTARLSEGDLSRRANVQTGDEIEDLAHDFNVMTDALVEARLDLEAKVRERTSALERSNRELEQFAYVASHDLQEPLRSVAGFVQLLRRKYEGKLDGQADEYIGFTVDAVKRMQSLIQDLLVYSRVGTQGKPLVKTDLNVVVEDVIQSLNAVITETEADVAAEPLPEVLGDDVQLGQLLLNLMGNAIKFRRKDLAPKVRITARRDGAMWQVSVQDNGIGIAPQHAERVFVIFQRLHRREDYPGTGIGLAVAKKIVERHGGRLWVEGAEGEGSTFHFTVHPPEAAPPGPEAEEERAVRQTAPDRGEELV